MGVLPEERISPSSAFTHTGLDYCVPRAAKSINRTFGVSQILTKETCLSILQRYSACRWLPQAIYIDIVRSFTGSHAELELTEQKINDALEPLLFIAGYNGSQYHHVLPTLVD